jgi:hypothetical protein
MARKRKPAAAPSSDPNDVRFSWPLLVERRRRVFEELRALLRLELPMAESAALVVRTEGLPAVTIDVFDLGTDD